VLDERQQHHRLYSYEVAKQVPVLRPGMHPGSPLILWLRCWNSAGAISSKPPKAHPCTILRCLCFVCVGHSGKSCKTDEQFEVLFGGRLARAKRIWVSLVNFEISVHDANGMLKVVEVF